MSEKQSTDAKERIVRIATRLFSQKGYEGAKMSEIASDAAVNKALIYYYFPTKQSILDHIIDGFFNDMMGMSMSFIRESILGMIETGRLDILPDRMHFTTLEDMAAYREVSLSYFRRVLDYMLKKRDILRIILSEALRTGEQRGALMRFFLLAECDDKNPLIDAIHSVDNDFNYSDFAIFRKFFFSLMPMVNFTVFHEDYKSISGLNDEEMLESYLRSMDSLFAGHFNGQDFLMEPERTDTYFLKS